MAPKKKEVQKLSLAEFASYGGGGSWADEVEDTYASGTQPLPASDRRAGASSYGNNSYGGGGNDRGYHSLRDNLPQVLPDKPPFTAHLGNLSYDATDETVSEFFEGCNIVNVRIIEDREQQRPKGFAYAEFGDLEGLKTALTRDGQSFQGRTIRIKVADPPRGGFERSEGMRDLDWGAKRGPLADIPGRGGERRGGGDFGERRREFQANDDGRVRDFGNWERRGPLSPLAQNERPESREGSRSRAGDARSESFRDNRRASPAAWGPGEGAQDGSRPPRREFTERPERPERPERAPTAAEKDFNWRNNMRADAPVKSPGESREGSAPSSPAPAAALPVGRPKLNLTKRTVSEAADTSAASTPSNSKASPFGAARPIDTAAREREIEEKRVKDKEEAEEKAKQEKLAKEEAAKEAAEKAAEKAAADKAAAEEAAKAEEEAKANAQNEAPAEEPEATPKEGAADETSTENKAAARPREPREPREPPKSSRAAESGNWRSASAEQRAPSRGGHVPSGPRRGGPARGPREAGRPPRANGSSPAAQQPQSPTTEEAPSTPKVDADGWTTVSAQTKGRRGGSNRPVGP